MTAKIDLSPNDAFIATQLDYLSDFDRRVLTKLYQPLLGAVAYSLYLNLWSESQAKPLLTDRTPHSILLANLNISLTDFESARLKLEGLGLIRVYQQSNAVVRLFIYELYAPERPDNFFKDDILSLFLYETVGKTRYNSLVESFKHYPVTKSNFEEVTHNFFDVFHFGSKLMEQEPQAVTQAKQVMTRKPAQMPNYSTRQIQQFDWAFLKQLLQNYHIDEATIDNNLQDIFNLHHFYGLDELTLSRLIAETMNLSTNAVDMQGLTQLVLQQYTMQSVVKADAPMPVTETPDKAALTKAGFTDAEIMVLQKSRENTPGDFLRDLKKVKGGYVGKGEVRVLRDLANRYVFSDAVINVLADYILQTNATLTQGLVDTIANDWLSKKVDTPEKAIQAIKSFRKPKRTRSNYQNKNTRHEVVPKWAQETTSSKKPVESADSAADEQALAQQQARLKALKNERRQS